MTRTRPALPLALAATLGLALLPAISPALAATTAAAPSDFDGDGRADLAIGAPGENLGSTANAGMINVLYGDSSGLTAAGDQAWSQASSGIKGTPASGDGFGGALASADFDRDGRADLAIGVPLDAGGGVAKAGAVNVLYGSASGLVAAGDQLFDQATLPDAPEPGDGFGQALAAGDFDGDGYGDLAIGAPGEQLGAGQAPGLIIVAYGGPAGLSTTDATTLTRASTGAPYLSDETPHGFGYALAAGDLDGDGDADLAVGSPASGSSGDDPLRPLVDGEVSVFYGGSTGLVGAGSQVWTEDSTGIPGEGEGGDWFGVSVAIGDFDGDGPADLAVGARYDRVGGLIAGAATVIYGTPTGLAADGAQLWHQDVAGVPGGAESGDTFGAAVAAGDLDGDGREDLAIGAPGEAIGSGEPGAGIVNVLYGTSSGLSATGAQTWSQDSAGVPGGAEATEFAWDAFGSDLAIANFGRSSRADLAVGVHLEAIGSRREAGMVNVIYGTASGLSSTGAQGWSQDSSGVKDTAETRDYLGTSLSQ
ncbi:MAG: hypothetical protein ACHQ02_00795 [Candidatus Limnocylindrales bacterium]|jgi:hypothetical protein